MTYNGEGQPVSWHTTGITNNGGYKLLEYSHVATSKKIVAKSSLPAGNQNIPGADTVIYHIQILLPD